MAATTSNEANVVHALADSLAEWRSAATELVAKSSEPAASRKQQHDACVRAVQRAEGLADGLGQHLADKYDDAASFEENVKEHLHKLAVALEPVTRGPIGERRAHPGDEEATARIQHLIEETWTLELALHLATPASGKRQMSPEDRRVSGLILLMLLAQAYYKMLECTISMASSCGALDVELNHRYLWVTSSLATLLKNHEDLGDFPTTFEPLFPDLYPNTIRDIDWEDMVAPEAEGFLSTVQQYVTVKGIYEPDERSDAWTFVQLFRPSVDAAIESAEAYRKRMKAFLHNAFERAERVGREAAAAAATVGESPESEPNAYGASGTEIQPSLFRLEADIYTLTFDGRTISVPKQKAKGLAYIRQLLMQPGKAIHVVELAEHVSGDVRVRAASAAGEVLDDQARLAYRRRYENVMEEREEAVKNNDFHRQETLDLEIADIAHALQAAEGLGARARTACDDVDRLRVSITTAIKRAIETIRTREHIRLADHLHRSIKCGRNISYVPEFPTEWEL